MAKTPTRGEELLEQLPDRPSILRSTVFHGAIRIITALIGWPLLFAAIGLAAISVSEVSVLQKMDPDSNFTPDQTKLILLTQLLIAALGLVLSLVLLFVTHLARSIVTRNNYIIDLEEIVEKQVV